MFLPFHWGDRSSSTFERLMGNGSGLLDTYVHYVHNCPEGCMTVNFKHCFNPEVPTETMIWNWDHRSLSSVDPGDQTWLGNLLSKWSFKNRGKYHRSQRMNVQRQTCLMTPEGIYIYIPHSIITHRIRMYAIYGNIYHQYTPVLLVYIPYMDPMGYIAIHTFELFKYRILMNKSWLHHMGVSITGVPKNGWFITESPSRNGWELGVPQFRKPPSWS